MRAAGEACAADRPSARRGGGVRVAAGVVAKTRWERAALTRVTVSLMLARRVGSSTGERLARYQRYLRWTAPGRGHCYCRRPPPASSRLGKMDRRSRQNMKGRCEQDCLLLLMATEIVVAAFKGHIPRCLRFRVWERAFSVVKYVWTLIISKSNAQS